MGKNAEAKWRRLSRELAENAAGLLETDAPDDSFGWGALLEQMRKEDIRPSGLLLTGPSGCGKHTAAAHMMKLLLEEGFELVIVDDKVIEQEDSVSGLQALADETADAERRLCIVADSLSDEGKRKALYTYFGVRLSKNRLSSKTKESLFVILIDGDGDSVPSTLRSRLMRCVMNPPMEETRWVFLENRLRTVFGLELKQYAGEGLKKKTEGFSYAQLKDLAYQIGLMVKSDGGDDIDVYIEQLAEEQTPEKSGDERRLGISERLCELLEALPEIVRETEEQRAENMKMLANELKGSLIAAVPPAGAEIKTDDTRAEKTQTRDDFTLGEEKRIENMSPKDLAADLFAELEAQHN